MVDYSNAEDTPQLSTARMRRLEKDFFDHVKKAIDEFELQPDAQGNYAWPSDFTVGISKPFEDGSLIDTVDAANRKVQLRIGGKTSDFEIPEWAIPLAEDYRAGRIEGNRKKLLELLIIGIIVPKFA